MCPPPPSPLVITREHFDVQVLWEKGSVLFSIRNQELTLIFQVYMYKTLVKLKIIVIVSLNFSSKANEFLFALAY